MLQFLFLVVILLMLQESLKIKYFFKFYNQI